MSSGHLSHHHSFVLLHNLNHWGLELARLCMCVRVCACEWVWVGWEEWVVDFEEHALYTEVANAGGRWYYMYIHVCTWLAGDRKATNIQSTPYVYMYLPPSIWTGSDLFVISLMCSHCAILSPCAIPIRSFNWTWKKGNKYWKVCTHMSVTQNTQTV